MNVNKLEYADKRMRQKWYNLVMAEQNGASQQQLERMYNAYMLAVEEYNCCSEQHQRKQQEQREPTPSVPAPSPAPIAQATTVRNGRRKKKAS